MLDYLHCILILGGCLGIFLSGIFLITIKEKYNSWQLFLLMTFVVSVCALFGGVLLFFSYPIDQLSLEKSGQFGDSFGVITAMFSGLAFAAAFHIMRIQKSEFDHIRVTLKKQEEQLEEKTKSEKDHREHLVKMEQTRLWITEWNRVVRTIGYIDDKKQRKMVFENSIVPLMWHIYENDTEIETNLVKRTVLSSFKYVAPVRRSFSHFCENGGKLPCELANYYNLNTNFREGRDLPNSVMAEE